MKYLPIALLTFAAIGCGHNEFDISPAQVSRRTGHPAGTDRPHLPPGAVKGGTKIKKGDRLPDGTIADHDGTITSDCR